MSKALRVLVAIDGPHLEPFEAVLDALEEENADVVLGPALLLGVGPSAALYLRQCGIRAWLDTSAVLGAESADAVGRIVQRVGAAGVVVAEGTSLDAVANLVARAGAVRVLVRLDPDQAAAAGERAQALLATGVHGVIVGASHLAGLGEPATAIFFEHGEGLSPAAAGRDLGLRWAGSVNHAIARDLEPAQALRRARVEGA